MFETTHTSNAQIYLNELEAKSTNITSPRLLFNLITLLAAIKQKKGYASVSLVHRYSYECQRLPAI